MDDINKQGDDHSLEGASDDKVATGAAEAPKAGSLKATSYKAPKGNAFKRIGAHVNIYLLLFIFVIVVGGIVTAIVILNSQKAPATPTISSQTLTQDAVNQLANTDAKVGDAKSVLTVQSNAVFAGQVVVGGDLSVAGTLKIGKPLDVTDITVAGTSNLGTAQVKALTVNDDANFNGKVAIKSDLTVGGNTSLGGNVTAKSMTLSRLVLDSNSTLELNNHILANGAQPRLSFGNALGSGGTASVNGSDTAGSITINTGGSPGTGCFASVAFAKPFTNTPRVVVSPVNAGAADLNYYVTRTTATFSVCTTNAAAASTSFGFDYIIFD